MFGVRVARDVRRPLMWLAAIEAKYNKHATAEKLNEQVCLANECTKPTARKTIRRAVDCGLITTEKDGANVFYFLTAEQFGKAENLMTILDAIPDVVKAQLKDPLDPHAGHKLVPPEVYYNIVTRFRDKKESRDE